MLRLPVMHVAPVLIGDGIRLFRQKGMEPVRLEKTAVSEAGQITDMRFRFAGQAENSQRDTRRGGFFEKADHMGHGDRRRLLRRS
jgi:hypothetical protein